MATSKTNVLLKIDSTPLSDEPLVLRSSPLARMTRGTTLPTDPRNRGSYYLYAKGGTGGYVFSIESSSAYDGLPPGLSLNATTGMVTGTPTTVGRFRFRAKVQDSSATVAEEDFTVDVVGRLVIRNGSPVDGEVTVAYSYSFQVTGNTGVVGWSLLSGTLPSGLSLSSDGVLSGTPDLDGISYFVVRATDTDNGDTLDIQCSVSIAQSLVSSINNTLTFYVGIPIPDGTTMTRIPERGVPPYRVAWDNLTSYPWLSFDETSLTFSGTPPDTVATMNLEIISGTCKDALGKTATVGLYFVVVNPQNIIQPQKNDADVGPKGPSYINLVEGANVSITASNDGTTVTYEISTSGGAGGGVETVNGIGPDSSGNVDVAIVRAPGCIFDNGGTALSGTLASEISIPYSGTISAWTIAGDVAGSASIVVSHSTYLAYDTMTTLLTATCTSAKKAQATGLSHAVSAGDILRFSGSGFASFTRCSITLEIS